jgi:hypothetical protein
MEDEIEKEVSDSQYSAEDEEDEDDKTDGYYRL